MLLSVSFYLLNSLLLEGNVLSADLEGDGCLGFGYDLPPEFPLTIKAIRLRPDDSQPQNTKDIQNRFHRPPPLLEVYTQ